MYLYSRLDTKDVKKIKNIELYNKSKNVKIIAFQNACRTFQSLKDMTICMKIIQEVMKTILW